MKSNHAEVAVSAHSNAPPTSQVEVVEPGPLPRPLPVRRRQESVPGEDGRGPLLVVGPGRSSLPRPGETYPVLLVGDNEYGLIGRQSLRRRPQYMI